jgi:hypothetical protein
MRKGFLLQIFALIKQRIKMKTTELTIKKNKGANIAAWILQVLLAGMFIMAGAMKIFTPIEELAGFVTVGHGFSGWFSKIYRTC